MKRAYFTLAWQRGEPMLDACLDITDADPADAKLMVVLKRLKRTATAQYTELERRVDGIYRSMHAIEIRMRFNAHHEGPFIVFTDEDILTRELLDRMVQSYHADGTLDEWLETARVRTPVSVHAR